MMRKIVLCVGLLLGVLSGVEGAMWIKTAPPGPGSRSFASSAVDYASGGMMLFGGNHGQNDYDETWLYVDESWQFVLPETERPPARLGCAMVSSPSSSVVMLFGGVSGHDIYLADTWFWDGMDWIFAGEDGPEPRCMHAMAMDVSRGRVVLFGGYGESGLVPGETWEYFEGGWQNVTPAGDQPLARYGHCMVFDEHMGVTVLFGGDLEGSFSDETWLWNGSEWISPGPPVRPSARRFAAMCWYPPVNGILLFGGWDGTENLSDTWLWTEGQWSELTPATEPPGRRGHTMIFDPFSQRVLMYGGGNDDFWSFYDGDWHREPHWIPHPGARTSALFCSVPGQQQAYLYGGVDINRDPPVYRNDMWIYDISGWSPVNVPDPKPEGRRYSQYAFNETDNTLVLFGGEGVDGSLLADTWLFDGNIWQPVTPAENPPALSEGAMAFDPSDGTVLLYGGLTESGMNTTMWKWTGSDWMEITPNATPGERLFPAMTTDYTRGVVWLFGGCNASDCPNDLWYWDGNIWTMVEPAGDLTPSGRVGHTLIYNMSVDRLLLFGGVIGILDDPGLFFNDIWSFDGTQWRIMTGMPVRPSARAFHGMASLNPGNITLMFGGQPTLLTDDNETWFLTQVLPPTPTPSPPVPTRTPPPTRTPIPPTVTPTSTPTLQSGIHLHLNQTFFMPHDRFLLDVTMVNSEPVPVNVDEYILLDVYGSYFYYPSWSEDVDFSQKTIANGLTPETIFDFEWPEVDSPADGIIFWAALLRAGTVDLFGTYDFVMFGYGGSSSHTPTPAPTSTPTSPGPTATAVRTSTPTPVPPTVTPTPMPQDPEVTYYNDDDSLPGENCQQEDIFCFEPASYTASCSEYKQVLHIYNGTGSRITLFCAVEGTHSFAFELEGSAQFTLEAGEEKDIRVRFCPGAPPGDREAYLVLSKTDSDLATCTLLSEVLG